MGEQAIREGSLEELVPEGEHQQMERWKRKRLIG